MKDTLFTVKTNREIAQATYEMVLEGDGSDCMRPGSFVNVHLEALYLRRPISVCCADNKSLTLVYKVVGKGTEKMKNMVSGDQVFCLTDLGNGFDTEKSGEKPVLVGGGSGVAPLFGLARALVKKGVKPVVALGFRSEKDVYYVDEFKALGCEVIVSTEDGTYGIKGFVTNHLPSDATFLYACGPMPMLNAARKNVSCPGEYSFEARMACGFGACMGCSMETKLGLKRVCKDGPVFDGEVILWP